MKSIISLLVCVLIAGLYPRPINAEENKFSITPKAGYMFLSKNLNLNDSYIYGIDAGYRLSGDWVLGFDFLTSGKFKTALEEKGYMHGVSSDAYLPFSGGVTLYSYNINMAYRVAMLGRFESYLKFGLGYTEMKGKIARHERTFDYGEGGVYHYPYKRFKDYHTPNAGAGVVLNYKLSGMFRVHAEIYDMVMFSDADFGKLKTPYHNIIINCGLQLAF